MRNTILNRIKNLQKLYRKDCLSDEDFTILITRIKENDNDVEWLKDRKDEVKTKMKKVV